MLMTDSVIVAIILIPLIKNPKGFYGDFVLIGKTLLLLPLPPHLFDKKNARFDGEWRTECDIVLQIYD